MIDNIRLMARDFDSEFILSNYKWEDIEIEDDPHKKGLQTYLINKSRRFGLRMFLTENLKTNTYSLSIDKSIRKWYFNKNSRKDLNFVEFLDCIKLLGEKLGLKKEEVWRVFKITKLEIGVTLLLKSDFRRIMDCFVRYRNSERDDKYRTTVYFRFNNYKLVLYDKFFEINKGQILTKKKENIFKKFHFLRFEVSVNKVSGTSFKKEFDTLELLKNNWRKLPVVLETYLEKIEFVDLLSKEKEIAPTSLSDYINYIKFLGMKSIGITQTIEDFKKIEMKNNRSKYFNDLINNYRSHISSDRDYKNELLFELKKKTDRLI